MPIDTPSVKMSVIIERMSETILQAMPDFNGEIEQKIKMTTGKIIENFDFEQQIRLKLERYLDEAIDDAVRKVIDRTDFIELLDLERIVRSRISSHQ